MLLIARRSAGASQPPRCGFLSDNLPSNASSSFAHGNSRAERGVLLIKLAYVQFEPALPHGTSRPPKFLSRFFIGHRSQQLVVRSSPSAVCFGRGFWFLSIS